MPPASGDHRRFLVLGLGLAGLSLLALMAWLGLRSGKIRLGEENSMPSSFRLEGGPAVERELAPEARHEYTIPVLAGEYLLVSTKQIGLDVRLELLIPGTSRVVAVDTPGGPEGFERVSIIGEADGEWHLVVIADVAVQDPGARYAISVERRAATPEDRRRVPGEYAFAEGEELRRVEKLEDAEARYAEALGVALEMGDRELEAKARHRIGWVRFDRGELSAAIEPLRRACDLAEENGDYQLAAVASADLGGLFLAGWKAPDAEQAIRRSLANWQSLGRVDGVADAWHSLGQALDEQGRSEEARHALEQALALSPQMSAAKRVERGATFRFSLGQHLVGWAEYATAQDLLSAALATFEGMNEVDRRANALAKLGEIAALENRVEAAKEYFDRALRITTKENKQGIALAENGLGDALIRAGELDSARRHLDSARLAFRDLGDRYSEAMATMNLGRASFEAGDDARAAEFHAAALASFEDLGDRRGIASNQYGLAKSSFRQGDLATARTRLDLALAEIESVRGQALGIASRSSYFASRQDYFDLDLALVLAEREAEPADEWSARAFAAGDRRRARSLLDLLNESGGRLRHTADPAVLAEQRKIQDQLNGLEKKRLDFLDLDGSEAAIQSVEAEERTLLARLESLRADLRRTDPRRAELAQPTPVNLDRARALLDQRTVLLAYSLGSRQSALWVVRREGAPVVHLLPPSTEIEELARRTTLLLSRSDAQSEKRRRAAVTALARMIMPPDLAQYEDGRLAIVVEGALQGVPFAALPDLSQEAGENGEPPPLVARFELVQLPSVSALSVLREEAQRRLPALGGIAVLADPVYSPDDPRVNPVATPARPAGLNPLPNTYRRLPATGREAEEILSVFPLSHRFVARDFAANRKLIRDGKLRGFRFVHFATHAAVDSERSDLSGLVLSTVDPQGLPIEGHLRLHEIYDLDLPAELVVLSACATGIGRDVRGEGLESLARGFLSAGTPRLVVSLWPVEDEGTATLMGHFYRELVRERQGPAAALRKAQLALQNDVRYRDPFHWAGFVFIGDWQFPGARKEDQIAVKDDLPIEQLHTGGTNERPRPANPLPGPRPKKRPPLVEPPPSAADEEGRPHSGKGAS